MAGLKLRRKNTDKFVKKVADLEKELKESENKSLRLKNENIKLKEQIRQLEERVSVCQTKVKEADQWLRPTWSLLSKSAKDDFKKSLVMAKETFPPGTNKRIREAIGFNMI